MSRTVTFPLKGVLWPEPAGLCLVGILGLAAPLRRKLGRLMIRKLLSSLPVVLLFASLSFGLAIPNTESLSATAERCRSITPSTSEAGALLLSTSFLSRARRSTL